MIGPSALSPPCRTWIALSRNARPTDEERIRLALLDVEPRALEPRRASCEAADTAFAFFGSAIFDEAWRHRAARAAVDGASPRDPALTLRLAEAEIRSLALAVIVFRLHAGTIVSEAAAAYIREQTGVDGPTAEREVACAALSPAAAYPGIAMILEEEMLTKLSYASGVRNPDAEFRKLLLEGRGLPLPILMERIPRGRQ